MADSPDDPIMPAIPLIREVFPDLYLAADMSLCEYTHHGHCAVVFPDGTVDNEASVARVSDIALLFAQAGVYCAASSDMSNGRTRAIKLKLLQHRLESRSPLCSTPPSTPVVFMGRSARLPLPRRPLGTASANCCRRQRGP